MLKTQHGNQGEKPNMLTPKQETFAQAIADGMNQSEAYRSAYNVGPRTKPETVHKRASELMADGQVAGRVEVLRQDLADLALWSRTDSVLTLSGIARGNTPPAAKIQAVRELNAMHGYSAPPRLDVTVAKLTPITDEAWL